MQLIINVILAVFERATQSENCVWYEEELSLELLQKLFAQKSDLDGCPGLCLHKHTLCANSGQQEKRQRPLKYPSAFEFKILDTWMLHFSNDTNVFVHKHTKLKITRTLRNLPPVVWLVNWCRRITSLLTCHLGKGPQRLILDCRHTVNHLEHRHTHSYRSS